MYETYLIHMKFEYMRSTVHTILVPHSSSHKSCFLFLRIYKLSTSIRLVLCSIPKKKTFQKFRKKRLISHNYSRNESDSSPMSVSFSSSPVCHLRLSSMLLNNEHTRPRYTDTLSPSPIPSLSTRVTYPTAAPHSHVCVNTGNIAWNVISSVHSYGLRL